MFFQHVLLFLKKDLKYVNLIDVSGVSTERVLFTLREKTSPEVSLQ